MNKIFTSFLFFISAHVVSAQFAEQWHTTINGQGDFSDRYTCLAQDNLGNVYLGGSTMNLNRNSDFMVAKYASNGALLWLKTWNGLGNGPDEANAIAVNASGVVATGYINNPQVGNDFFTIALSADGDSLWAAVYNDTQFNQYEQANAIAIDNSGNVLVTGESDRDPTSNSNDDFLTVKYSSEGTFLWAQRFNDLGNATDRAAAIKTGSNGDVYVAGRSDNGNDDDYAILKYNQSGTLQWSQFIDNGGTDRATGMGMDSQENIYITGRSDNGNDDDFRTVKINSSGLVLWSVAYDNVEDDRADYISVTPAGDFIVAGRSDNQATAILNYVFRVVMYNSSGQQQWTAFYDGPVQNSDDIVRGVSLATDGSAYVTGYSDADGTAVIQNDIVTIRYNSGGSVSWINTYAGINQQQDLSNACLLASSGNVFVAGSSENSSAQLDALILQYNPAGELVMEESYDGYGDNSENVRKIITDATGNVYVAGYMVSKDTDRNMFVAKLDASGDTLWTRQFTGTLFGSDEEANGIAIAPDGGVVIGGYTKNTGTGSDVTVRKYSSSGVLLWSSFYNGSVNESDRSFDLALDATGNVYITGKTDIDVSPLITNDQVLTIKYNTAGVQQWLAVYDGGSGIDRGEFIQVAANGNVYVGGKRSVNGNDDFLIIKYNNAGQQQWAQSFAGPGGKDEPFDMEIDADENVFLTGASEMVPGMDVNDYFTIGVGADGVVFLNESYNGLGDGNDVAEGIEVRNSKVYITGFSDTQIGADVSNDCVTICYDYSGSQLWMQSFSLSAGSDDIGDDLTVAAEGSVVVTCHSNTGTSENIDYALNTIAYNPDNGELQQQTTLSVSDSLDVANVIHADANGIYLGGSTWSATDQRDILVVKYDLNVGVAEMRRRQLFDVYPNPCVDEVCIRANNTEGFELNLTDAEGKLILMQKVNSSSCQLDVSALPAGAYFITIGNAQSNTTKKIIKK